MRVMVTGGTGFIGRHVVGAALSRGHSVIALSRSSSASLPGAWEGRVEVRQCDLREASGLAEELLGVDAVVHCAAAMDGDLATQRAITVEGTRNLLEGMCSAGVGRIVGISSFAVYDFHRLEEGALLDEGSPLEEDLDSRAPYVRTKREQENLVRERALVQGWHCMIFRPGLVFGPGRTWFHHLGVRLGRRLWVTLAGEAALPLIYVENCADAIVAGLAPDAPGGVTINLVDDDLPTRSSYVAWLAAGSGSRPVVIALPWAALARSARMGDWINRQLLMGKAPLPDLLQPASLAARCKPLRYSNQVARSVLGWRPRWTVAEGLARSA
jgi:nucleoside-diphosphate-sugar epimerase